MSGLTIDDEILRRKRDPYENMDMYGINPAQQGAPGVGGKQGGGLSEFGIPISVVEEAKNTDIFSVAAKVEGTTGGAAAASFAPTDNTVDTGLQTDSIFSNQPMGEVTVQPPNTSGTQVLSSALTGAERNDSSSPQGGATDDKNQPNYQHSQEGNLTSIAYSGNGENTTPLKGSALDDLNSRLGMPSASGEATLTATDSADAKKEAGEATLTASDGADNTNGTDGTKGTEGAEDSEEPGKTEGNVNGSGNEDNAHDVANGEDKEAQEAKAETAEQEAKRLAEEQQEKQLKEEAQKRQEEEKARQQQGGR